MFLLIDNYDSFTYNLLHFFGELGAEVAVKRNDALSTSEALELSPQAIIISPGPCNPNKSGICLDLLAKAPKNLPIFGVCLGHQAIAQHFGGTVTSAPEPMHGKIDTISHNGKGIFKGIKSPFKATRYHSLVVLSENLPNCLEITAKSPDGVIQGISHKKRPIYGVQFHPESIASEHGHLLIKNFIEMTKRKLAA